MGKPFSSASRVIGNLVSLLALLKGLPMTYNRDLQEDKERLFDTADTVRATVRLTAAMLRNAKINRRACQAAASDPSLLATDLAEYLVRKGLPFRKAHHAVGALVALAERQGKALNELTVAELQAAEPGFAADALQVFEPSKALARRNLIGAPGRDKIASRQRLAWLEHL